MPINSLKDAYFLPESPKATNPVKIFLTTLQRYTLHALHLHFLHLRKEIESFILYYILYMLYIIYNISNPFTPISIIMSHPPYNLKSPNVTL